MTDSNSDLLSNNSSSDDFVEVLSRKEKKRLRKKKISSIRKGNTKTGSEKKRILKVPLKRPKG